MALTFARGWTMLEFGGFFSQQEMCTFLLLNFSTKRDATYQPQQGGVSRYSVVRKAAPCLQPLPKKSHEWEEGKIASP